jgi:hypothetical protein
MNARIKELVAKADEYADSLGLGGAEWCDAQLEKLTELFIQECMWQVVKDNQVPHDVQVLIGDRFKEHFGVK